MVRKLPLIALIIFGFTITYSNGISAQDLNKIAQKKRAQTSMKFLSVSPSANSAAMSDAVTSLEMGASSVFYNPAAIAAGDNMFDFSGGVVQYIADINYNTAAMTFRPSFRKLGVIGINFVSVDYGEIQGTALATNAKGYEDTGLIKPTAVAMGVSYANAITDQFSVGANFRYVKQNLGAAAMDVDAASGEYITENYSANTIAVDFGVLYRFGFKSLTFAMAVQNFSREIKFDNEQQELPLTFKIGLSMDLIDLTSLNSNTHKLIASVDAHRPRDYDEQLVFGLDYGFLNRFHLRGGYALPSNDEKGYSFGGGISQPVGNTMKLGVDYAYTQFGVFGNVNRISVKLDF